MLVEWGNPLVMMMTMVLMMMMHGRRNECTSPSPLIHYASRISSVLGPDQTTHIIQTLLKFQFCLSSFLFINGCASKRRISRQLAKRRNNFLGFISCTRRLCKCVLNFTLLKPLQRALSFSLISTGCFF